MQTVPGMTQLGQKSGGIPDTYQPLRSKEIVIHVEIPKIRLRHSLLAKPLR
ncbi:hypothetical protein KIN20_021225 [Parelaphostrongylus tenuis]|uniref:Uncharacterized protein n=1 Tax=Parelaphostrongylus tenuis TaxID=148309 RepID=A0AAD5N6V5_PARTN|nr:hypothetical protein KIN20_021225 [Parelaphostrongylus tenuis]